MAVKFHHDDGRKVATPVRDAEASLFDERWKAELRAAECGMRHGSFSVEAVNLSDLND